MIDAVAAEWLKLRTVRSTYWIVGLAFATLLLGSAMALSGVSGWDSLPPERRVRFQAVPMEQVIAPIVQLSLAVLAVLAITSEYATGLIRATVTAAPRRWTVLAAKASVLAAVTLVAGTAIVFAMFFLGRLIVGDRPMPGHTSPIPEEIPRLIAATVTITVVALFGLGLGAVLRSTAGALSVLFGFVFVLPPIVGLVLPEPWDARVAAFLPPGLADGLAGTVADPVLSPLAAGLVLAGYVVISLGAGVFALTRRDC
ncbi:ABC transporter permease [Rhizohabitans arisaemae]|uniref:ABC transporter permease n=1 Tax=Rhizohabitans arisaemae TaxID=2720610 RepID=UPI0024B25312|nr:ABC transporter permease subunit [Rhizohabitans arisaemae]